MDAIASGTISLAGNTMCNVPTMSDFNANARKGHNLDDVRAIASYRGLTAQQIQDAIDAVGPDATLVAEHLHIPLDESSDGAIRPLTSTAAAPQQLGWNTLEELREVALAEGCNADQIAEAIQAAKHDPCKVAHILHTQLVNSYLKDKREAVASR